MRDLLCTVGPDRGRPTLSIPKFYRAFLIARKADGFSEKTLQKYETALRDLEEFASLNNFPSDLLDLQPFHIRAWLTNLRDRSYKSHPNKPPSSKLLSPNTQWTYWMVIRAFYKWACKEGYIKKNPCENIKGPKQQETVIRPLDQAHIEALLRLCPPNTWWGARDRALIIMLLTTGMRRGEIAGIRLGDIELENNRIKVSGKGDRRFQRKERYVAILPQLIGPLINWLRFREKIVRENRLETDALWLGLVSSKNCWLPLSSNAIGCILRRLKERVGIKEVRLSAHTFRHTFALNFARARMVKRNLQEILGHRDPRSTEAYTRYVDHELALQEQRELNPFKSWKL